MSRPPSPNKLTRLNLDLSVKARERLNRLQVLIDARSMSEVLGRALAVYETILNEHTEQSEIIIRKKSGKEYKLLVVLT